MTPTTFADTLAPATPAWLNPSADPKPVAPAAAPAPAWLMPEPTADDTHDAHDTTVDATMAAADTTNVARDHLQDLEAQADPLRQRLAGIEAELAKPAQPVDATLPFAEALAERRAAKARTVELEVEREVVASILDPLEAQVAVAKVEAAEAKRASARATAVANGIAALDALLPLIEQLADAVDVVAGHAEADRAAGINWHMTPELHFRLREVASNGALPRAMQKLRAIGRF